MPIEQIPGLSALLSGAYKVVIAKALSHLLSKLRFTRPQLLRDHYGELVSALSKMPFIYKDLTTLVLKDFVEVKFELLDPTTLERRRQEEIVHLSMDERIRNRSKALFIGNAGMGKTTFFRYTALSLATSSSKAEHFFPNEQLVPFYVPLKAVNNTKPHPILTYLLESHRYLAGKRGFQRLYQLAYQKRLFLLLDGYDEIYVPPPSQANFLVDEITTIFSGKLPAYGPLRNDKKLRSLYEALRLCRAWLSSRREFYAIHPLGFTEDREVRRAALDAVAISVSGLHNRSLLVTKIFDIYRSRADVYREKLNEESFLQDIDLTGDEDLIDLSFNPLFLTVMCYIHAQNLKPGADSHTDYRRATMSDLVLACIDLLLRDLDAYRVREVPAAQREVFREVFEKRRSLYEKEKEAFLGYFANRLLSKSVQVFDEEDISQAAKEFFRIEYREGHADEILRGLESARQSEHGFVRQLLNQGVFVLVPKTGETRLYDFPHRRFREVLAARYLNTPERVKQVTENLGNPQYAEFIYVFFSVSQYQNQILEMILERVDATEDGRNFGVLAVNCLRLRPRHYDATPILMNWLRMRLDNRTAFRVPRQIIDHIFPSRETVVWLQDRVREAIAVGDEHVMAIVAPILLKASKPELIVQMISGFDSAIKGQRVNATLLYLMAEVDSGQILQRLDVLKENLSTFRNLVEVYSLLGDEGDSGALWSLLSSNLSFEQRVVLADVVQRVNPGVFPRFERNESLADELELLAVIARHVRELGLRSFAEDSPGNPQGAGDVYIITRSVLRVAEDAPMRKILREFVGEVHAQPLFLDKIQQREFRSRIEKYSRRDRALIGKVAKVLRRQSTHDDKVVRYFY